MVDQQMKTILLLILILYNKDYYRPMDMADKGESKVNSL